LHAELELEEQARHLWPYKLRSRKTGEFKCGFSDTRLESIYNGMIGRCHRPEADGYHCYGGKGIEVCPEWRASRKLFYLWSILNGYEEELTLDRQENHLGYSPQNCRWVTQDVQQNNRKIHVKLECRGITLNLTEWSRERGMEVRLIEARLEDGWSAEEALGFVRRIRTERVRSIL
jgi:hypothetical protein